MLCKDIPSVLLNTGSCVGQVGPQVEETVAVRIEVQIYDMVAVGSGPEGGARQRGVGGGGWVSKGVWETADTAIPEGATPFRGKAWAWSHGAERSRV